jgi:small-conductance mechanosensitive channel
MKKPFTYALVAIAYIVTIVLAVNSSKYFLPKETILIPMVMLSLFVLSAAIMGFLFLSEPLKLFLENHKEEAVVFFAKTVGIFACFVALFAILILLVK